MYGTTRRIRTEPTDAALIAAAQTGDVDAFGELVKRHQAAAIRIAAIALGTDVGADDVAQDAFVKAYRALGRFRAGARFEPWLFRIVTNTARTRQRGIGRYRLLTLRASNQAVIDGLSPAEIAVHRTDRSAVLGAINRLRDDDRLILTYRWYHDLSEAEIAAALGCRPGTVKSRLNRAMTRLRSELDLESERA